MCCNNAHVENQTIPGVGGQAPHGARYDCDHWSLIPMPEYDGLLALDRMERAVEKIRDRLLRSTAALEAAREDVLRPGATP